MTVSAYSKSQQTSLRDFQGIMAEGDEESSVRMNKRFFTMVSRMLQIYFFYRVLVRNQERLAELIARDTHK